MATSTRSGDLLAGRYRLGDLLSESGGGRFWRAHDRVLERHVALHVIPAADDRAARLLAAARESARVLDPRLLRVLDAETVDDCCFVVNEWGEGMSLDLLVAHAGPLGPRRSAWLVAQAAEALDRAHAAGIAHGRLNPENLLVDRLGGVRLIGLCVDAALHGLPAGTVDDDVRDLAGLLHCALTGTWAGASASAVTPVPRSHGRLLSPRQVRAGVPRPLDQLWTEVRCDAAAADAAGRRAYPAPTLTTARGVADELLSWLGDPLGLPEALAASLPRFSDTTVDLPPVPEIMVRDAPASEIEPEVEPDHEAETEAEAEPETRPDLLVEPEAEPEPEPEPEPRAEAAVPEPDRSVERPTEAGMPVFGDDDQVGWIAARRQEPAPPPPLEDPPERPLFATDPSSGAPVRRPRPVEAAMAAPQSRHRADVPPPPHEPNPRHGGDPADSSEFWPWETGAGGRDTGQGLRPVDDEPVPGRRWLRLATAIGLAAVLLVASAVAYNLGRGRTPLGGEPDAGSSGNGRSAAPAPTPRPITGLTATSLDPAGDPPEENPEEAPLAVDGDDATAWGTQTYEQQLGPAGLKEGVGLVIDLGASRAVTSVDLTFGAGAPTGFDLYVTDDAPTTVEGLTPTVSETAEGSTAEIDLDDPVAGRYVVVWLTSLPSTGDGYGGEIAEVGVDGT